MLCRNYCPKEQAKTITLLKMDYNGVPLHESKSYSIIPSCIGAADCVESPRLGLSIHSIRFRNSGANNKSF